MTSEMSRANRPHIPQTEVDFCCVFCAVSQAPGGSTRLRHVPCAMSAGPARPAVHQHRAVGVSMEEGLIFAPILPAPLASHSSWEEDGGKQMLDKTTLGRILSVTQNMVQLLRV